MSGLFVQAQGVCQQGRMLSMGAHHNIAGCRIFTAHVQSLWHAPNQSPLPHRVRVPALVWPCRSTDYWAHSTPMQQIFYPGRGSSYRELAPNLHPQSVPDVVERTGAERSENSACQ